MRKFTAVRSNLRDNTVSRKREKEKKKARKTSHGVFLALVYNNQLLNQS